MTNQFCKNLTIFEGCDGSGKTVAAKEFAEKTGALYYHFDALDGCENVSQVFIDAMLPALLGVQDVVFDRSWLSEKIYGKENSRKSGQNKSKRLRLLYPCQTTVSGKKKQCRDEKDAAAQR